MRKSLVHLLTPVGVHPVNPTESAPDSALPEQSLFKFILALSLVIKKLFICLERIMKTKELSTIQNVQRQFRFLLKSDSVSR